MTKLERQQKYRDIARAKGLCICCKHRPVNKNRVQCRECLTARTIRERKRIERMTPEEKRKYLDANIPRMRAWRKRVKDNASSPKVESNIRF